MNVAFYWEPVGGLTLQHRCNPYAGLLAQELARLDVHLELGRCKWGRIRVTHGQVATQRATALVQIAKLGAVCRRHVERRRRDVLWIFTAGGLNILTAFLLTTAFALAPISTTLPLSRTAPIWVLLVSYLFLGKLERVTGRTVLAAALVVTGGVLITAFRN